MTANVSLWTEWRTTIAMMFVSAWMGMKLNDKVIDSTKYSLDLTFDVEVLKLPTKGKE